jgi:Flp pilus assembly protein TadG
MFQNLWRFLKHSGGNTAMMMALAAIPLCLAVGVAVDYSRATNAKSAIQAATDAAALAAVKNLNLSKSDIEEIVAQYLAANGIDKAVAHLNEVTVEHDKKTGTVSVRVVGSLDTSLMQLAGIQGMDIGGYSEVQAGGNALEVALVLDNTFSMSASGRMAALKTASHAMLDELFTNSGSGTDIKVSIVPFSDYVNVGMSNRNASWISVPSDYSETLPAYLWTKSNCRQVPVDGVASVTTESCDWTRGPQTGTYIKAYTWEGCVGSRGDLLDTKIDQLSITYPGLLDNSQEGWDNVVCGREVTPLTANKSTLSADIDAMQPLGETYIPVGLLWGWNMIDSNVPFAEAKTSAEMENVRGSKVIILMTDGDNTLKPQYPWHLDNPEDPSWGTVANQKTAELCKNIKNAGISIYTVSLNVTAASSLDMLNDCASSPAMAFNADDNAALVSAFKDIAGQLAAIHISR